MDKFDPEISLSTEELDLASGKCRIKGHTIRIPEGMDPIEKSDYLNRQIQEFQETVVYEPCNLYRSAKLGIGVKIGMFAEVGHLVKVGDRTTVGMGAFLCEGVTIENDVFIGPRVCFSNDMYPPSDRSKWEKTTVRKGAAIGANATICPGVTIGEGSIVGAGAVVTKDIGDFEIWSGVPAVKMRNMTLDEMKTVQLRIGKEKNNGKS